MRKTRLVILPGTRSLTQMCCVLLYLSCPSIGASYREQLDITRDDLYSQNIREIHGKKGVLDGNNENICFLAESRINCKTHFNIGDNGQCSDSIHHGSLIAMSSANDSCALENCIRSENSLGIMDNIQCDNEIKSDAVRLSRAINHSDRLSGRTSTRVTEFRVATSGKGTRRNAEISRNSLSDRYGNVDYARRVRMLTSRTLDSERREQNDIILPRRTNRLITEMSRFDRNRFSRHSTDSIHLDMRRRATPDQIRSNRNIEETRIISRRFVEPSEARRSADRFSLESHRENENRRFDWNSRGGRHFHREQKTGEQIRERLTTKRFRESALKRVSNERDVGRRTTDLESIRLILNKDTVRTDLPNRYSYDRKDSKTFPRDFRHNRISLDRDTRRNSEQTLHRENQRNDIRLGSETRSLPNSRHGQEQANLRQNRREETRLNRENISPRNSDHRKMRHSQDIRSYEGVINRNNRLNIVDRFERNRIIRNFNSRQSVDRHETEGQQRSHRRLVDKESRYNTMLSYNRKDEQSNRQKTSDYMPLTLIDIRNSREREISFDRNTRRSIQRESNNFSRVHGKSLRREKRSTEYIIAENLAEVRNRNSRMLSKVVDNRRALREIDTNLFEKERRVNREDSTIRRQTFTRDIRRIKTNNVERLSSERAFEEGVTMRRQSRLNTFNRRSNDNFQDITRRTDRENRHLTTRHSFEDRRSDRLSKSVRRQSFDIKPVLPNHESMIKENEHIRFETEDKRLIPSRSFQGRRIVRVFQTEIISERRISDKVRRNSDDYEKARRTRDNAVRFRVREFRASPILYVESIIRKDVRSDSGKNFDIRRNRASLHRYGNNKVAVQNEINTRRILAERRFDRANKQRSDTRHFDRIIEQREEIQSRKQTARHFEARRNNQGPASRSETRRNIISTGNERSIRIITQMPPLKDQRSNLNSYQFHTKSSERQVNATYSTFEFNLMYEGTPFMSARKFNDNKRSNHYLDVFKGLQTEDSTKETKWTSISSLITDTISLAWNMEDDTKAAVIGSVAFMLFSSKVK